MASNSGSRSKFIASAIQFAMSRGFQGIDLDWEYPNHDNNSELEMLECARLSSSCEMGSLSSLRVSSSSVVGLDLKEVPSLPGLVAAQSHVSGPTLQQCCPPLRSLPTSSASHHLSLLSILVPVDSTTGPQERTDFTQLLREMYPACKQAGLLLTAATHVYGADQNYELSEIHKYLDW